MRKQTKIAALVSAAALLAIGASMTALAQPGWNIDAASGTATYHDRYDDVETDVWHTWTDGKYYYFGDDGYMVRSQLVEYNEALYYVDSTGAKVTNQWVRLDNENGDTVGDNEVSNIYYFFSDGTGKAKVNGSATVRINNNTTDTAKFFFDDQGRMLSGWQTISGSTYYLGEETDGRAVTGWQQMEPNAEFEDPYAQDLVWYYFNADGTQVKSARKYLAVSTGAKYWFAFNADGSMVDANWSSVDIATANYGGVSVSAYYATDGYQKGTGWVQAKLTSSSDTKWFYLDAKGVPFNYNKTKAISSPAETQADTKDKAGERITATAQAWKAAENTFDSPIYNVAAKVIKNKTYLFDENGQMLSGVYKLTNVYREGSANCLGGDADGEIYYFDTAAATEGAMAVNKKIETTNDDVTYNYSFGSDGAAATDTIVNGTLYGANGVRIDSETGTWMVYTIPKGVEITSDKNTTTAGVKDKDDKDYGKVDTIKETNKEGKPTKIIVNTNGRVKESGTVIIDGTKYWVKSASASDVAKVEHEGATTVDEKWKKDDKAYVVVMETPIG